MRGRSREKETQTDGERLAGEMEGETDSRSEGEREG